VDGAPQPRPLIEFGVQLYAAPDAGAWRDLVLRAEDLGYSSVHLPDHVGGQFGPLVGLTAAAMATSRLRVGILVLNSALRNPVVAAKELATLDVVSGGRLQIGLGAGWQRVDFTRTGLAWLAPSARVRRVREYVDVLEAFWLGKPFSYRGAFYDLADVACEPRPVQAELPLLIGGGSQRLLELAGRRARVAGLDVPQPAGRFDPAAFLAGATAAQFEARAAWVRDAAAAAGRQVALEMAVPDDLVHLDVTPDQVRDIAGRWLTEPEALANIPLALVGDLEIVARRLLEWQRRTGISRFVVQQGAMQRAAPLVERLARSQAAT
jgi:probable F420-dependent oxidoreductase